MISQTQAVAALEKVKPVSPCNLSGAINASPDMVAGLILRHTEVEGKSVFWAGLLDAYGKPHILLCHELEDDGEELTLRGIHNGAAFVARITYSLAFDGEPSAEEIATLAALVEVAFDERIVGPLPADQAVETPPPGLTTSPDPYL